MVLICPGVPVCVEQPRDNPTAIKRDFLRSPSEIVDRTLERFTVSDHEFIFASLQS